MVSFAPLPREVRNKIYKYMINKSKTVNMLFTTQDHGQPEDWRTLRAKLHVCRALLRFAEEAFEAFFELNTFRIEAEHGSGFLNRPAYYTNGRGFIRMMLVKAVEIGLTVTTDVINFT